MKPLGSAILLAGGQSRRMGQSKQDLPWGNTSLLEHMVGLLRSRFDPVIIVSGEIPRQVAGAVCVTDFSPGGGPLGGLLSGLAHAPGDRALAVACDMPFLQTTLLEYLWRAAAGWDAVVPMTEGRPHPLCAVYSTRARTQLEIPWDGGERSLKRALPYLKCRWVWEPEIRPHDPELKSFINLNTPEEYEGVSERTTSAAG